MDIFLNILINILEEGFIYGIMAMGVYISYKVMKFPDLSVDGTFPLGMCVTASLITVGVNPLISCIVAFIAGCAAGCITGLLNVKLKITDLLSGILVMTAMWSVNLAITRGSAVLPFYNKNTIFNSGLVTIFPEPLQKYRVLIIAALVMLFVKILMDLYLKTKSGLLLRAAGDNPQFVTSMSKDPGIMKIIGLAIGNGCTALAGAVLSQHNESANITAGTGMVVLALASVIIGTSLFRKIKFMKATSMVVVGAIIYKACLVAAMQLGLPTNYLKLLMAALFTVALVSNNLFSKTRRKQNVQPNKL